MSPVSNDMNTASRNQLEEYVKKYKIFIDTCSLVHPNANQFWMNVIPFLKKYNNRIIISHRVVEELGKLSKKSDQPAVANNAKNTLRILYQFHASQYIEVKGEKNDSFADNVAW